MLVNLTFPTKEQWIQLSKKRRWEERFAEIKDIGMSYEEYMECRFKRIPQLVNPEKPGVYLWHQLEHDAIEHIEPFFLYGFLDHDKDLAERIKDTRGFPDFGIHNEYGLLDSPEQFIEKFYDKLQALPDNYVVSIWVDDEKESAHSLLERGKHGNYYGDHIITEEDGWQRSDYDKITQLACFHINWVPDLSRRNREFEDLD